MVYAYTTRWLELKTELESLRHGISHAPSRRIQTLLSLKIKLKNEYVYTKLLMLPKSTKIL